MAKIQKNSATKEAKRLLEDKLGSMPIDSENRLHVISNNMENALRQKEQKIAMLVKAIDESFPPRTPNRGFYFNGNINGTSLSLFDYETTQYYNYSF